MSRQGSSDLRSGKSGGSAGMAAGAPGGLRREQRRAKTPAAERVWEPAPAQSGAVTATTLFPRFGNHVSTRDPLTRAAKEPTLEPKTGCGNVLVYGVRGVLSRVLQLHSCSEPQGDSRGYFGGFEGGWGRARGRRDLRMSHRHVAVSGNAAAPKARAAEPARRLCMLARLNARFPRRVAA